MKKIYFLPLLMMIALIGCNDSSPELPTSENVKSTEKSSNRTVPIATALKTSNTLLGKSNGTRNDNDAECIVILREGLTRSSSNAPDTIAYLFNYPDDNGFSIISAKTNVFPVLAYSDTGNFDMDNEISKANFIDNIACYVDLQSDTDEFDFEQLPGRLPIDYSRYSITYNLSQGAPFDKYVIQENPGCPTGCVAVAATYCMLENASLLRYHDEIFNCESITRAMKVHDDGEHEPGNTEDSLEPEYSYEEAVDKVAKLMYYIGKDINMTYTTSGSGISSKDITYNLLVSTNYDVSDFQTFEYSSLLPDLWKSKIAFVLGTDYKRNKGHAWVVDGIAIWPAPEGSQKSTQTFIHCNWGWGGNGNGFFNGDVLSVFDRNYTPRYFFTLSYKRFVNITKSIN